MRPLQFMNDVKFILVVKTKSSCSFNSIPFHIPCFTATISERLFLVAWWFHLQYSFYFWLQGWMPSKKLKKWHLLILQLIARPFCSRFFSTSVKLWMCSSSFFPVMSTSSTYQTIPGSVESICSSLFCA